VYQQVIVSGNFAYLEDFLQMMPAAGSLYTEIAQKFQGDVNKASRIAAFKRFLRTCTDHFLIFDIAKELNLEDVVAELPEEIIQWKQTPRK